jgi:small subunit ribosomal protein S18
MSELQKRDLKKRDLKTDKRPYNFKKRSCPLSGSDVPKVDYKNIKLLKRFLSEKGKILPSRITSVSTKKQRELSKAVKRARFLALLPYVNN